jgi:DNA-binding SARP family transcriptional activator
LKATIFLNQETLEQPNVQTQMLPGAPFSFYLLGELCIVYKHEQIPAPLFRVHGLLAALLLQPRSHSRDHLAGLLFPDMPPQAGRRRLSDLLWLLRKSLPQLPLYADSDTVCLPPETRWLDVNAFQQAAILPDLEGRLKGLALYRGDLLPSAYDDWLLPEREMLYLQYVRLAHRVGEELLQHRRFDELLPLVERLVQSEPYDEKALRLVMQAYRAVGRRGAALAAYERFLTLAAGDLGTAPEPATQALAESIRCLDARVPPGPILLASGDSAPEVLLHQAREALARGDRATVKESIRLLHLHPGSSQNDVRLLEIDLALFFEEYDHAAALLEGCDAQHGPVLVRLARLALERRQAAAAHDAASQALIHAHETGDRQTEMEAVLALAYAQRQLGQSVQAVRSAEQALDLARACGSREGVVRALTMKGHNHLRQGQFAEALAFYREARSLAQEYGLSYCLADALHQIGWMQSYQGALVAALSSSREALSMWRDLGLSGREASTLQGMAYTLAQLGSTAESMRALEQAHQLYDQLGEPVRAAVNHYYLADTMLYQDDALAGHALTVIQEALTIFRANDQPGWEAAALCTQGHALAIRAQYSAALDAFGRAYTLYERLGELAFLPELLAYQGLAHLGLEQHDRALACTRQALLALAQGQVTDEVVPEIYYAHAMALAAGDQTDQARAYLSRAYQKLLEAAAQLQDEAARQAFFHHNHITRRLMQQLYAYGLVPAPMSGVVSQQLPSTRSGQPVPVTWTLDAGPADVALRQARGAIALRRARLARLLQEAQAQGATPTAAQLAKALDVSKRTLQRDLAALRQEQKTD